MLAFEFNNKHSYDDYKIYIKSVPNIELAKKKISSINIPGRSSKLTFDEEAFEDIKIEVECFIKGERLHQRIDEIKSWLIKGRSDLIFSFQKDRKYKGIIFNIVDFEFLYKKAVRFKLEFECEPFKYMSSEEEIQVTVSKEIVNIGTYYSEPILKIECVGNGVIKINDKNIKINGIDKEIIINSSIQNAYNSLNKNLNNKMEGEFPKFKVGVNTISFSGGITKIVIEPKWRWI